MTVAKLKLDTKLVEREMTKKEEDAFYNNYTMKRRLTTQRELKKREIALAKHTAGMKEMDSELPVITNEKNELHEMHVETEKIKKDHAKNL
jgi:hypothetical protein